MEVTFIIILFSLGLIGSFLSGLLGIGGAIIKYPLLLYIPPLFGVAALSAYDVSGIISIEVFVSSFIGVWAYRKSGYLNKKLIVYMGSTIFIGSLIGSYSSRFLMEESINIIYGVLAVLAAVLMFVRRQERAENSAAIQFNGLLASALALVVGIASGVVGAGGSFLLVPIMLTLLHIPTRTTIATSLAITFIASFGGSIGKIASGQVDFTLAFVLIIASLVAVPIGVKVGQRMQTKWLRLFLALIILATAIKIWLDIIV